MPLTPIIIPHQINPLLGLGLPIPINSNTPLPLGRRRLLGRRLPRPLILGLDIPLPLRTHPPVPDGEEGLREVGLDAPALVVDVVVRRIVARDVLQRVERQRVPAVVVHRLHHATREEGHAHARAEHRDLVPERRAQRVEQEALDRVVVERAVGVGDVEAVVARVPVGCDGGVSC